MILETSKGECSRRNIEMGINIYLFPMYSKYSDRFSYATLWFCDFHFGFNEINLYKRLTKLTKRALSKKQVVSKDFYNFYIFAMKYEHENFEQEELTYVYAKELKLLEDALKERYEHYDESEFEKINSSATLEYIKKLPDDWKVIIYWDK